MPKSTGTQQLLDDIEDMIETIVSFNREVPGRADWIEDDKLLSIKAGLNADG